MENASNVHKTAEGLPEMCASRNTSDNRPILIKRGESGYYPALNIDPDVYNKSRNITKAQEEAMLAGSMFGWNCKSADPKNYETDGSPIRRANKKASGMER